MSLITTAGTDRFLALEGRLAACAAELLESQKRLRAAEQSDVNLQRASEAGRRALLKSACGDALELSGASSAVLCVRDDNEGHAIYSTTCGLDPGIAAQLGRPRIEGGVFGPVMASRSTYRHGRTAGDATALGLPEGYPDASSALVVPIAGLRVVYGWICCINKVDADAFDDDDERVLANLALQVARIYENRGLVAELQSHTDQLKEEIAERKRATELLRESELRFRQLAESIREVFFLVGPSFAPVLYVSPAYLEIWGRTCESLHADPGSWVASIHPEDRERALRSFAPSGEIVEFDVEYRIERPAGGVRWIRARGFPIRDGTGQVYRVAGIAADITEEVRLERVLRESEAAMTRADVVAQLAHVISRPDGSFQSWSESLPLLIGREPSGVPANVRAWLEIIHPDDRERFRATSSAARSNGARTEVEYRIQRGDGELIHVRQVLDPMRDSADPQGRNRWFNTLQDVTRQKRAEEDLRESERRFSDMLANVQLLSMMLDRGGKIVYCNDFLLTLTGWRREEVLGRSWFELFLPPDDGSLARAFETLMDGKPDARHHENEIMLRSGARRLIQWDNSVLRSPSGEVIGTASLGVDVTERARAQEEVRHLNANLEGLVAERTTELQAANRELEAFSFSVSHDLRAPLQAVQGYAEALAESPTAQLSAKDRHYLDRIQAGSVAMDGLIDDLLSLASISRADLVATDVDLSAIALQAIADLRAIEPERRCEITVRPGMHARGDAGLLRIVLTNLIGNAWKFSGGREVTQIEVGELEPAGAMGTFFVRDHGAGFDPAYSQKLFGTFQRLHTRAEFPGTGIGLATVQRVIERHDGTVRAQGAVNQGATFFFSLPVRALPGATASGSFAPYMRG